jgi:hypothetical protein
VANITMDKGDISRVPFITFAPFTVFPEVRRGLKDRKWSRILATFGLVAYRKIPV